MADKKKKSQAEKAASASKKKKRSPKKVTTQKGNNQESKQSREKTKIPVRVISSIMFISLFVLFFVMFINSDGMITSLVDKVVHGLIGRVGFIVSIPVLLYLFIIHAFSGKRPVKMRTICLLVFVLTCSCLDHAFMNPEGMQINKNLTKVLFDGGDAVTGGVLCGGITVLVQALCGQILTIILLMVASVLTVLGGIQITIPSIVRAFQNRPRLENDEKEAEDKPEPASIVVNHIANKRIERIEKKRSQVKPERAEKNRASEIMRQIDSDVAVPVAAAKHTSDDHIS